MRIKNNADQSNSIYQGVPQNHTVDSIEDHNDHIGNRA